MRGASIQVRDVLAQLDLGNSVAENDRALERYFVETSTFRLLVQDGADIVAGDKGTGKTALFRILSTRYAGLPELENVEVVAAFNPVGNPVFQRLTEGDVLEEGQYVTIWKAYVLALVGNWLLELYEESLTDSMFELDRLLARVGLRLADDSPSTVFSRIVNLFRRITDPAAVEFTGTLGPQGIPIVTARVEIDDAVVVEEVEAFVRHEEALGLLERCLDEVGLSIWLVMDRLDEAFQGFPLAEIPALRALLRTYLDMNEFPHIRLKLFVRNDLFRRIISGGFVNLSHVNSRKTEIVWGEEDLYDLLVKRLQENPEFTESLGVEGGSADDVFSAVFPEQVDPGRRKPKTWVWMLGRIRDANGVRPPRNLIDLVQKAQSEQQRREDRAHADYVSGSPLVASDALKRGLARLSSQRVEDTLLAEAGEHASLIEEFRGGKAEHSRETVSLTLDLDGARLDAAIEVLQELGFLEKVGTSYKIPMLYRDGLGITQGKAFSTSDGDAEDEEEEE